MTSLLPQNYSRLSLEDRRAARVAACSRFDTAEEAVESWAFFRDYYLRPDPEGGFDPGFYKYYIEPSKLHHRMVEWAERYKCTAFAAPRKSAKSTTILSLILWQLLTRTKWSINLVKAKDDFVIDDFESIKYQLENNERILEDFGEQKPPRGSSLWTNHRLILRNRNSLRGLSVDGKLRGPIADLAILDDIEDDKSDQSRNEARLMELKERLLKVIVPMLDRTGHVLVIGTLLSQRSFLYHVIYTKEDRRFKSVREGGLWFKINVPAMDAQGRNSWRAKFTKDFLNQQRELLGDAFFQQEYMGDPRSEQDALFSVKSDLHEYELAHPDEAETTNPFQCTTEVVWHEQTRQGLMRRAMPYNALLNSLLRGITVDYAPGLQAGNDYSSILVWGLSPQNELFILDGWFGRQPSPRLTKIIWDYALLWRVATVGVEAVSIQMDLFYRIQEYGEALREKLDWCPICVPVKYPANLSKADRISALEWRFNHARVKFPRHRRDVQAPHWGGVTSIPEMYKQIRNFTPDLRGLPHDDVIDTLAMAQYVTRTGKAPSATPTEGDSVVERMLRGEMYLEGTNIPMAGALDISRLTLSDLGAIISVARELRSDESPLLGGVLSGPASDWGGPSDDCPPPRDPFAGVPGCPIFRPDQR